MKSTPKNKTDAKAAAQRRWKRRTEEGRKVRQKEKEKKKKQRSKNQLRESREEAKEGRPIELMKDLINFKYRAKSIWRQEII